ncbi:MAG: aldo/keto reductase [Chthoniobacterales bacterium]|nr:aldo/keto reductase [Chthoniobacterales bacterium]
MKYRTLPDSNLQISEVGFGLWTVSTGWWGTFTDEEAIRLMRLGADLGITLFDAADTYGNGRSEELLAKAFTTLGERERIVIATKVGYDFINYGGDARRGQREIPQNFSPQAIKQATEAALKRLKTDHIDILQLHNIRLEQVLDDALWETLDQLKAEGKIRHHGVALGPAIGWLGEGAAAIATRQPDILQHIYNMLEQEPGSSLHRVAEATQAKTKFFVRVPHSSGMLEGKYTTETVFPPSDHRSHRPRKWLLDGIQKVEQLRFLEKSNRTLGQAALQWLLHDPRVATVLPNIYNEEQLREFANTSETPSLIKEEMDQITQLYANNFGLEAEEGRFKGTMSLSELPSPFVERFRGLGLLHE